MSYKEIVEQTGIGSTFLKHLEIQILKNFLLGANHDATFVGSMNVPICPKKLVISHWKKKQLCKFSGK